MSLTQKKPLVMPKPVPSSEADRLAEAVELLTQIKDEDIVKLTTWELETIDSIREGRAVTRIRLKDLRECVERIRKSRG